MKSRPSGKYPLALPVLGLGCWSFGGGDYWGPKSQRAADETVRWAVEHGCPFFDTAEVYNGGESERALGTALQGLDRGRVIVATKISPSHATPDGVAAHCEASLRRLRTDYLDVYLVHWPITERSIRHFTSAPVPVPSVRGAFEALQRLQESGKVRWIGVSNFGRQQLSEALATGAQIVLNELPYSLLTRAIESDILPFCREQGIGVVGYMSLMQGVLADLYPTLEDVPKWQRRTRHFDSRRTPECRHGLPGAEAETAAALAAIRAVATRAGLALPALALKWVMARPGMTSSLCGSASVRHLQANIEAAEKPLDASLVAELNRLTEPLLHKLGPSFDYYEGPENDRTR